MIYLIDIPRKLILTGLTDEVVNLRHLVRVEGKRTVKLDLSGVQDLQLAQTWAALRGAVRGKVLTATLDLEGQPIDPAVAASMNQALADMLALDVPVELLHEERRVARAVAEDKHVEVPRPHAVPKEAPKPTDAQEALDKADGKTPPAPAAPATTPVVSPSSKPPGGAKVDETVDAHPSVTPKDPERAPAAVGEQVTSDGVRLGVKVEQPEQVHGSTAPEGIPGAANPPATGEAAPSDPFANL